MVGSIPENLMRTGYRAITFLLIVEALSAFTRTAHANNLTITNVTLSICDDSNAFVRFDISWENSWRYTNVNHDAAWVFFKVRAEGSDVWNHAYLEADAALNPSGYSVGSGTELDFIVPEERTGVFLRRRAHGVGNVGSYNVKALWKFASNDIPRTSQVFIQACGIEMVYVDEGAFYLGSGGQTNMEIGSFTDGAWISGTLTSIPYLVTSENAITIANNPNELWGTSSSGGSTIGGVGVLSNAFPKGYAAFYCMKYEITQAQYRDFLNTLTRDQQIARTASQTPDFFALTDRTTLYFKSGIRCPSVIPDPPSPIVFGCDGNVNGIFNEVDDSMDRAATHVSWADLAAYLDWAGLRPMTELEYEKACRGPLQPVPEEYAWGSTVIFNLATEADDGTGYSTASPENANSFYSIVDGVGPTRAGIFATPNSTREKAGATYWGIMEMSGNVSERFVSAGNATGRAYTGLHGDGSLGEDGNADVDGWPGANAVGSGYRGVYQEYIYMALRVSSRQMAASTYSLRGPSSNDAGRKNGGRGGRNAPAGVGP